MMLPTTLKATPGAASEKENVAAVQVNNYLMDVELPFSPNPCGQQSGGRLAAISPLRFPSPCLWNSSTRRPI